MEQTPVPASSAEEVQPSTEVVEQSTAPEGTGASEQAAETEEQRRASEAGRTLAEQRRKNQAAAAFRREFEETRRLNAEAMRQNAELTRALIQATQGGKQQATPTDEAPKREAFDSFEEWNRADARYWARKEAQETLRTQLTELSEQAQQHQYRQMAEQVEQAHGQRLAEYATKVPDFEARVEERGAHISVPDEVGHLIKLMPDAPQIIDAMLQYPQLAQQFWSMPRHEQFLSLGKISHALQNRPQVSKAPPPGKPVGAKSSGASTGLSDDDSLADWMKKRNAQQARR